MAAGFAEDLTRRAFRLPHASPRDPRALLATCHVPPPE